MMGLFAATLIYKLTSTFDWHISGLESWDNGAILLCWHGEILLAAAFIVKIERAKECWAPIVQEYRLSHFMTQFTRHLGLHPVYVPGYEHPVPRRAALTQLASNLGEKKSMFLAADGHRGPGYRIKQDPLWLAKEHNMPILPMAFVASSGLTLPTWDKKVVPFPKSRVAVAIGPAIKEQITAQDLHSQLMALKKRARDILSSISS